MKRIGSFLLGIVLLILCFSGCSTEPSETDDKARQDYVKMVEQEICEEYNLESFTLLKVRIDTCDCSEHDSSMSIFGMKTEEGVQEEWGTSVEISYDRYKSLWNKERGYIVYTVDEEEGKASSLSMDYMTYYCILQALAEKGTVSNPSAVQNVIRFRQIYSGEVRELSPEDSLAFLYLLAYPLEDGLVSNCPSDYEFLVGDRVYLYHTTCGNIVASGAGILLSEAEQKDVNQMIAKAWGDSVPPNQDLDEFELFLERRYGIEELTLQKIFVETCECAAHENTNLFLSGTQTVNGAEENWGKSYDISAEDFERLCDIRNWNELYDASIPFDSNFCAIFDSTTRAELIRVIEKVEAK